MFPSGLQMAPDTDLVQTYRQAKTSIKKKNCDQAWCCAPAIPVLGGRDRRVPGTHWLASLAVLVTFLLPRHNIMIKAMYKRRGLIEVQRLEFMATAVGSIQQAGIMLEQ